MRSERLYAWCVFYAASLGARPSDKSGRHAKIADEGLAELDVRLKEADAHEMKQREHPSKEGVEHRE